MADDTLNPDPADGDISIRTALKTWLTAESAKLVAMVDAAPDRSSAASAIIGAGVLKIATAYGRRYADLKCERLAIRLALLEARPAMKYCGVWEAGLQYEAGDIVTHSGSAWHAGIASKAFIPGSGAAWVLMVKRGKDGKGLK